MGSVPWSKSEINSFTRIVCDIISLLVLGVIFCRIPGQEPFNGTEWKYITRRRKGTFVKKLI